MMMWTLRWMRSLACEIVVGFRSVAILGIDYVFALVIDVADVHVFVIFGAEPLWMQLFLMLLSCAGAVYHLSPDRLSRAFIEIIILFCIRLHISVFILY